AQQNGIFIQRNDTFHTWIERAFQLQKIPLAQLRIIFSCKKVSDLIIVNKPRSVPYLTKLTYVAIRTKDGIQGLMWFKLPRLFIIYIDAIVGGKHNGVLPACDIDIER